MARPTCPRTRAEFRHAELSDRLAGSRLPIDRRLAWPDEVPMIALRARQAFELPRRGPWQCKACGHQTMRSPPGRARTAAARRHGSGRAATWCGRTDVGDVRASLQPRAGIDPRQRPGPTCHRPAAPDAMRRPGRDRLRDRWKSTRRHRPSPDAIAEGAGGRPGVLVVGAVEASGADRPVQVELQLQRRCRMRRPVAPLVSDRPHVHTSSRRLPARPCRRHRWLAGTAPLSEV